MKKILITIAGVLLIVLVVFYFYAASKTSAEKASLWDYVPSSAVIVYENRKPAYAPAGSPDFAAGLRRALKKDSIFISPANTKEIILSLHVTGKEDFGILFYMPDSSILTTKPFKKLLGTGRPRRRNFEGFSIVELPAAGGKTICYTTAGKNIMISREAFLIEDVIRSQQEESTGFRTNRDELFHLMPLDAGQGKLYASVNGTARFAGIFLSEEIKSSIFRNPVSSVITDARLDNRTLLLNGFAIDSVAGQSSLLSLFNDQRPVTSEIQKIISSRSLLFIHYGIPDYPAWNKRRTAWNGLTSEIQKAIREEERKKSLAPFYQCLGNEAGYCYLDGTKGQKDDVFLVRVNPGAEEKLIGILSADQQPAESYASYPIHTVAVPEFLKTAFWPVNENKNLNFYTRYDPYFVFAENAEVLKGFLNDIEEDNTWGKSAEWNAFFKATSLETNLSIEFNGALLGPWMLNKYAPRWDSVSFPHPWGNLDKGAFQFSRLNYNYYFNGVVQFDPGRRKKTKPAPTSVIPRISFPDDVNALALVKSHTNNAPELLIQTSDKTLTLTNTDLKTQFAVKLRDKIQGAVVQIDYYRNKKLQYLFLAGRRLYLIDRLGNDVRGFPLDLDTPADPEYLTVLDYDNTRQYRFLITDVKGNLLMMDKEGKMLEGWDKQSAGTKLSAAPRLVRDQSKDYIIATTLTGSVHAFSRKGEIVKGFPVASGIHPQGDWFFEKRGAGQDALITMMSSEGVKIQIGLNGKVVNKENFVRAAAASRFSLMASPTADDFAVSRIDRGKIAVLNRKGEVLFERENPGSEVLETDYLLPSAGEKIFSFRDAQQDFTYLFSEQGVPVFNRPVESTLRTVMIRRAKDGVMVFAPFGTEVKKYVP